MLEIREKQKINQERKRKCSNLLYELYFCKFIIQNKIIEIFKCHFFASIPCLQLHYRRMKFRVNDLKYDVVCLEGRAGKAKRRSDSLSTEERNFAYFTITFILSYSESASSVWLNFLNFAYFESKLLGLSRI